MTVSTDLSAEAGAALSSWLHDHPTASGVLREAMRAHIHLRSLFHRSAPLGHTDAAGRGDTRKSAEGRGQA